MSQDHIMMQNGRVLIVRNSETMRMDEEITMPDGTKITADGTMMLPDGTTRLMVEGETILLQADPADPEDMPDRQFKEAMEDEELRDDMK